MGIVEYESGGSFPRVIGSTAEESSSAWSAPIRAGAGSPNVLTVVLDDTGYGQLGCYGSPIATPNFDSLAADGLRYSNMHTTVLCSPSRSCILTGRNHHSNAHPLKRQTGPGPVPLRGHLRIRRPIEPQHRLGQLRRLLRRPPVAPHTHSEYPPTDIRNDPGTAPFGRRARRRGPRADTRIPLMPTANTRPPTDDRHSRPTPRERCKPAQPNVLGRRGGARLRHGPDGPAQSTELATARPRAAPPARS